MKLHIDDSAMNADVEMALDVAGHFAAKRLGLYDNVRVIVYRTSFLGRDAAEKWGECQMITPHLFAVKLAPRCVRSIQKLEHDGFLIYFHELIHVAQMAHGRLTYTRVNEVPKWNGRIIADVPYNQDPSEIEAWQKGRELTALFLPGYRRSFRGK